MPTAGELRILFLTSNPEETSRLDLEEELRSLEIELRGVRFRETVKLSTGHAVRPDDLVRLLRSEAPNVVHFSGHGSASGIILRTDTGYLAVPGAALERLFRDRGVDLVILNACHSREQALSLGRVVPIVIGTSAAVGDEAARRFTVAFYRTLGDGFSVREAFRDGGDAVGIHNLDDVFVAYGDLDRILCASGGRRSLPGIQPRPISLVS
jgi:CHAT domain-containing protein